jgi:hypothetical protein
MRRKQLSGAALASTSQLEEPHLFIEEFDHETCRLCSLKSSGCFGIFSAKGVKKNLPALVKNYLNLEVYALLFTILISLFTFFSDFLTCRFVKVTLLLRKFARNAVISSLNSTNLHWLLNRSRKICSSLQLSRVRTSPLKILNSRYTFHDYWDETY